MVVQFERVHRDQRSHLKALKGVKVPVLQKSTAEVLQVSTRCARNVGALLRAEYGGVTSERSWKGRGSVCLVDYIILTFTFSERGLGRFQAEEEDNAALGKG